MSTFHARICWLQEYESQEAMENIVFPDEISDKIDKND